MTSTSIFPILVGTVSTRRLPPTTGKPTLRDALTGCGLRARQLVTNPERFQMSVNNEFKEMSPLEKKMAKLSIKYQADFMSMTVAEVENILSESDWYDLSSFIKNGCREITLH